MHPSSIFVTHKSLSNPRTKSSKWRWSGVLFTLDTQSIKLHPKSLSKSDYYYRKIIDNSKEYWDYGERLPFTRITKSQTYLQCIEVRSEGRSEARSARFYLVGLTLCYILDSGVNQKKSPSHGGDKTDSKRDRILAG